MPTKIEFAKKVFAWIKRTYFGVKPVVKVEPTVNPHLGSRFNWYDFCECEENAGQSKCRCDD